MKRKRLLFCSVLVLVLCAGSALVAQTTRQQTTTLLPMDSPRTEDPNGLLWVQESPKKETVLQIDLSGLPPGMQESSFLRCTLRLVAKEAVFHKGESTTGGQPVIVKGRTGAPGSASVASLSPISENPATTSAARSRDGPSNIWPLRPKPFPK